MRIAEHMLERRQLCRYIIERAAFKQRMMPLRNFEGAVYAWRAFQRAEGSLRSLAGRSYAGLVVSRARAMFDDLRYQRADVRAWAQGVRSFFRSLRN